MVANNNINIPLDRIRDFCRKWKIREFSLFGSVLRDDFGPDSDIDVLLSFEPRVPWSLWDIVKMREELMRLYGRDVDIVEKEAMRNPYRRHEILKTHRVIYAA